MQTCKISTEENNNWSETAHTQNNKQPSITLWQSRTAKIGQFNVNKFKSWNGHFRSMKLFKIMIDVGSTIENIAEQSVWSRNNTRTDAIFQPFTLITDSGSQEQFPLFHIMEFFTGRRIDWHYQ